MSNKPNRQAPSAASVRRAAQANQRSRMTVWLIVGAVVVVCIAGLLAVALASGGGSKAPVGKAANDIAKQVAAIPASVTNQVGQGSVQAAQLPQPIPNGTPLTVNGKPEVLYIGAEYCPYCAAERWSLVNALSRFGGFTDLRTTTSSATDQPASLSTFSFHNAGYESSTIAFKAYELYTNQPASNGNGYEALDTLDAATTSSWNKITNGRQSFPFINIGGKYAISGATYDISLLEGKSWAEITKDLQDPTTDIAKGALGSANAITAAICETTNGQPSDVCNAPAVAAIRTQLTSSSTASTSSGK